MLLTKYYYSNGVRENETEGECGIFYATRIAATVPTLIWYEGYTFPFSNLVTLHIHHNTCMPVANI